MGVNDAQEMLDAAQAECIRLERELAELKAEAPEVKAVRQLHDICVGTGMEYQTALGVADVFSRLNTAEADRDAALAVVEQLRDTGGVPIVEVWQRWREIFAQTPTTALAKVKADTLREAAQEISVDRDMGWGGEAGWLEDRADRIEKEVG